MENLDEKKLKNRKKYESRKHWHEKYYLENREKILEKMKSAPDYKEKLKDKNQRMREYKTEWARKKRESDKRWRDENKQKISDKNKLDYLKRKEMNNKLGDIKYLSKISKIELIKWAVEFVERVERRKGLVSFEELFGELLGIAFYLPSSCRETDTIGEQLTKMWVDVKYFANSFKKELGGISDEFYDEMKSKGICRYCEVSKIQCSHNVCYKCRSLMIYIDKLG